MGRLKRPGKMVAIESRGKRALSSCDQSQYVHMQPASQMSLSAPRKPGVGQDMGREVG